MIRCRSTRLSKCTTFSKLCLPNRVLHLCTVKSRVKGQRLAGMRIRWGSSVDLCSTCKENLHTGPSRAGESRPFQLQASKTVTMATNALLLTRITKWTTTHWRTRRLPAQNLKTNATIPTVRITTKKVSEENWSTSSRNHPSVAMISKTAVRSVRNCRCEWWRNNRSFLVTTWYHR